MARSYEQKITYTLADCERLYQVKYGGSVKIRRIHIISGLTVICLVTPCTNWAIPLIPIWVKKDKRIRFEKWKKYTKKQISLDLVVNLTATAIQRIQNTKIRV